MPHIKVLFVIANMSFLLDLLFIEKTLTRYYIVLEFQRKVFILLGIIVKRSLV